MPQIQRSILGRRLGLASEQEGGGLIINRKAVGSQTLLGMRCSATISSAQLLALFATPQTILAAQGSGIAIIPKCVVVYKPAGTAYAGIAAGEDLVLKYTNASGAQCCSVIETTGFLDQTTAQTRVAHTPGSMTTVAGDYAPVANAAVVMHLLTAEITTGDSPLYVRMFYDLIQTVFTD